LGLVTYLQEFIFTDYTNLTHPLSAFVLLSVAFLSVFAFPTVWPRAAFEKKKK
jgi:hypothetical protein